MPQPSQGREGGRATEPSEPVVVDQHHGSGGLAIRVATELDLGARVVSALALLDAPGNPLPLAASATVAPAPVGGVLSTLRDLLHRLDPGVVAHIGAKPAPDGSHCGDHGLRHAHVDPRVVEVLHQHGVVGPDLG